MHAIQEAAQASYVTIRVCSAVTSCRRCARDTILVVTSQLYRRAGK